MAPPPAPRQTGRGRSTRAGVSTCGPRDTGDYYDSADAAAITAHLQQKRLSQRRERRSAFAEQPAGVADDPSTLPCLHPRIAFRDVTRVDDGRTLRAALIPGGGVVANQAPFLLRVRGTAEDEAYVLGVLCSMPCAWQARRTVEMHMASEQIGLLSVPDPGRGLPVRDRTAEIAGRLAAADERFAEWAQEAGVPVGSANDEAVKHGLVCELDACVAWLYGLDEDDLAVVYETFSETADHSGRHRAALAHYRRIAADQTGRPKAARSG